ncbi:MAG: hypothetical protein ACJ76J_09925, partial [Thermoanaerobaculia bacterium]
MVTYWGVSTALPNGPAERPCRGDRRPLACYHSSMQPSASPEPCPICGGRGWVVSLGGGAGRARACSCRERDAVARLLEAAGIPPRYRHCR